MKNMSIKKKVTLYYSLVLIGITVLILGVFIVTMDNQTNTISSGTLKDAVQNSFEDIESEHSTLQIDDDFDNYYKGVTLLVYSDKGDLIKGSVPAAFKAATPLTTGKLRKVETANDTWLVYDLHNTYDNGQGIWVRGIYAMDNEAAYLRSIIIIMLIILPILLLLAILAGRRITKRAFAPVSDITEAAQTIGSGKDLSRRLPVGANKDELYYLTETLNDMMARLETAFKAEKQFTSDVSHELRTPVSVVLSECELLLKENHDGAEYRESIEMIQKQCKRTMALIQQLLQLSRTMDKEAVMEKERLDLSALCRDMVDEYSKVAEEQGIEMEANIENQIFFNGDQTLLIRMMANLLTNAVKYNEAPGTVWMTLSRNEKNTVITVSDDGIGISEEDQKNIFNRFYKADRSRAHEGDSFGLGLAMVRWIAEAHGGEISVESTLGQGSVFTVILPEA